MIGASQDLPPEPLQPHGRIRKPETPRPGEAGAHPGGPALRVFRQQNNRLRHGRRIVGVGVEHGVAPHFRQTAAGGGDDGGAASHGLKRG